MVPWTLFLVALAVRVAVAWPQEWPGYMDATYYTVIARNLAAGRGLTETVLWNYVDRPTALPHPSNAHWMPLTSFVAAPFLWLFGDSYRVAQIPFVLLSSALVPLTYVASERLFGERRWALLSAGLVLSGGTYFAHWSTIDAWAIYALLGTALLALGAAAARVSDRRRWLVGLAAGVTVGLAHLTRADGPLLFVPLAVLLLQAPRRTALFTTAALGYLVVMAPWMARNVRAFGRPLVGGHLLWLQDYNDLFTYEKDIAAIPWTIGDWLGRIVDALGALGLNFASLAGALQIVFLPFLFVAFWTERRRPIVQATAAYVATLFLVISFAFALPGPRGTFLHSLSAVIVLCFALAPAGLAHVIRWTAARRSNWNVAEAERFFAITFFGIGTIVSATAWVASIPWYRSPTTFTAMETMLRDRGERPSVPVFCIDATACHYWMDRPALMIPMDGDGALCRVAHRFGARYLILEGNHPRFLESVHAAPTKDSRFDRLGSWTDAAGERVHLLRFRDVPPERVLGGSPPC